MCMGLDLEWRFNEYMKQYLMSGEESKPGIVVYCHKGSSRLEHINKTEFAPIPLGSEVHVGVALHVLVS